MKLDLKKIALKISHDYEMQANVNKSVFKRQMKDFITMKDLYPIVGVRMINDDGEIEEYTVSGRYLRVINWLDKKTSSEELKSWEIEEVLTDKIFARKISDKWI